MLSVTATDAVSRYGTRFTVGALIQAIYDTCLLGIPMHISHDLSRPIGWSYPRTVYFEPGLTRTVAVTFLPETEDDNHRLTERYEYYYYNTQIEPNQDKIEELRQLLDDVLLGDESLIIGECIAFSAPGLAKRKFEKLFSQTDKHGLVLLRQLESLGAGIYKIGDLVVFAHRYLRRNLFPRNSLNYPLLQALQHIDNSNSPVRIALDPDMVGLADGYMGERMEYQYWWGPKFNDSLASIPAGVTHHEANELERLYFGISATEFRWGIQNMKNVFEAEEVRDFPSATLAEESQYGCRYVHSIVNPETGLPQHLDGAVRLYSEKMMIERLSLKLDEVPRNTEYVKLWRVDGTIEVGEWKRLVSDHFRDNPLVGEYLGGIEDNVYMSDTDGDTSISASQREEYVPYSMDAGTGLRIALSFGSTKEFPSSPQPTAILLKSLSDGATNYPFVEAKVLQLQSILRELEADLILPRNIGHVTFHDLYVDFPLIYVSATDQQDLVMDALCNMISDWQGDDVVVCYKIGFPVDEERAALISIMGHVDDVDEWLKNELSRPPTTYEPLRQWGEDVAHYLRSNYSAASKVHSLSDVLVAPGVLTIPRRHITGEFKL